MKSNSFIMTVKPSQLTNLGWFVLPFISLPIFIPLSVVFILIAVYKYYEVDTWSYNLYTKTIEERRGVFDVLQDEMYYFRIKSILIEEPLWMRIFGLSNIQIISSEQFKPRMTIHAVYLGDQIKETISDITYEQRLKMNIRDHDVYNI
jgi:membrane protein YdbS with pleckstrin-like domain